MTKTGKLSIIRGDDFHISFANYYSSGNKAFERSHKEFNERKYSVGETDISYRVINHWDQSDLLPDGMAQGGWRKFNFVELAWLRVVQHLRDFGLPLDLIETAKRGIIEWDKERDVYLYFEHYLVSAMVSDTDTYAIINREGLGAVATADEIAILRLVSGPQDLIAISLKGIVTELGLKEIPSAAISLAIDSRDVEMMEILNAPGKEIKFSKKDNRINGVETTEVYPNLQSVKDLHKKFKDKNSYGEVTIKYENGKEQSAEVKTRRKFGKK